MAGITHPFVSAVVDAGDPDEVGPDEWNAVHDIDDLDLSATTLRLPSNASALATDQGEVGWDSTNKRLRIYDTQRERVIGAAGWTPFAYPMIFSPTSAYTTGLTLSAAGESVGIPIYVPGHMLLDRFRVRNLDTASERSYEWRVYVQRLNNGNSGEATLDEIPGANGTETFTPSGASTRASDASGAPVYVPPGVVWVVLRNNHGSNSFSLGTSAVATQFAPNAFINGDIASALGSTLDFTNWTSIGKNSSMVAVRLDGRVFGQTTEF